MQDVMPTTWFMSRRLPLPLAAATTALDELLDRRRGDEPRPAVPLTDRLDIWPAAALPGAPRRFDGRLYLGRLTRPLPVELELGPWSRTESEVGLRPTRRPGPVRAERYWDGARRALETLRAELPASAPTPSVVLAARGILTAKSAGRAPIVAEAGPSGRRPPA